jgi:hypothetical protein
MLFPDFENIGLMFLLFLLSELLHEYIMHIKIKNTKIFCFYFLNVCLQMFYWIAQLNEMIIAICFQLLYEFMNDYISFEELLKPRNTPVSYLQPPYLWRISNKMAKKSPNRRTFIKTCRTFLQKSLQRTCFFSMMIKQMQILTYISYMRLLEYDYVLITYLTNLLMVCLMLCCNTLEMEEK